VDKRSNSSQRRNQLVGLPRNLTLPFFAYGIFKSDELAWPRIQQEVDEYFVDALENCAIRLRNGLPVLVSMPNEVVEGERVCFSDSARAYEAIGGVEPSGEYKWMEVTTRSGCPCNVLVAVNPNRGMSTEPISRWTSAQDPSFVHGMAAVQAVVHELRAGLLEHKPWVDSPDDWDAFFRLQGAYLVLWSIAERLASFRFGAEFSPSGTEGSTTGKIYEFANVSEFQDAIKKAQIRDQTIYSVRENRPKRTRPEDEALTDSESTKRTLRTWYQIRSNITHRGKSAWSENVVVLDATIDLYNTLYFYLQTIIKEIDVHWETRGVGQISRAFV
jgi:hypothetical protein